MTTPAVQDGLLLTLSLAIGYTGRRANEKMPVGETRHSDIEELINGTYRQFEIGDFSEARRLLDQAHSLDFEDKEVQTALRACGFWAQRVQSISGIPGNGSRGDYLRRQWSVFEGRYRDSYEHPLDEGRSRLKIWVHSEALAYYRSQEKESNDTESALQIGRCLKILGRYEEAIENFENALKKAGGGNARCMADLSDTYALIGEIKPAKVLMREALYIDASQVEIDQLAAPVFRRLIDNLENEISRDAEGFNEWLPVYGTLWSVLDVTRELSPVEYGRLKQSIYALKSEIADGDEKGRLTPRLINSYFRLIDHYQSSDADRTAIEEALMNLKLLSPSIYGKYYE